MFLVKIASKETSLNGKGVNIQNLSGIKIYSNIAQNCQGPIQDFPKPGLHVRHQDHTIIYTGFSEMPRQSITFRHLVGSLDSMKMIPVNLSF